jgi:phospholipid/cholesterol/gamma-HCH transport system ATP-binding protein
VFGRNMLGSDVGEARDIRRRWGVLFQGAALFSTLTVTENVQLPIREYYGRIDQQLMDEIAPTSCHGRPARGCRAPNIPPNCRAA